MANPSKKKGTAWETAVVDFLSHQGWDARRKVQAGRLDEGDISIEELPWLVIEAKASKSYDLADWVEQANSEADNAGGRVGVVWAKRKGKVSPGDAYVILDGDSFSELIATVIGLHEALAELDPPK